MPVAFVAVAAGLSGLVVGSFLNVVIHRGAGRGVGGVAALALPGLR